MGCGLKKGGQDGAVTIVEAAFVFPIMFIIIFIMVMLGEVYYQRARVEHVISQAAVLGAARCENPMLGYIQNHGNAVPTKPSDADVAPYRYIFTGRARTITNELESEMRQKIQSMKPLAFRGMSPADVTVKAEPHLNPLVSSLKVECDFNIKFPIRMIWSKDPLVAHYTVSVVEPVGDPAELVRNISMVQDIMERLEVSEKVEAVFSKIKEAMDGLHRIIS